MVEMLSSGVMRQKSISIHDCSFRGIDLESIPGVVHILGNLQSVEMTQQLASQLRAWLPG